MFVLDLLNWGDGTSIRLSLTQSMVTSRKFCVMGSGCFSQNVVERSAGLGGAGGVPTQQINGKKTQTCAR